MDGIGMTTQHTCKSIKHLTLESDTGIDFTAMKQGGWDDTCKLGPLKPDRGITLSYLSCKEFPQVFTDYWGGSGEEFNNHTIREWSIVNSKIKKDNRMCIIGHITMCFREKHGGGDCGGDDGDTANNNDILTRGGKGVVEYDVGSDQ